MNEVDNSHIDPGPREELLIDGASVILYSAYVLNQPVSDKFLNKVNKEYIEFRQVNSRQGYTEKMFALGMTSQSDHLVYKRNVQVYLPPTEIDNSMIIRPRIAQYVTLYMQRIVLVQSVIVFDRNQISGFPELTTIDRSLTTDDLLRLIHAIRTDGEDCNAAYARAVHDTFIEFIAGDKEAELHFFSSKRSDQSISVQIWDIASLHVEKGEEIVGAKLAEKYAWEISALLSCYNEHFTRHGLWRLQSPNQVNQAVRARTDVLGDHRILISERVCLEISQINHPELRAISASRLNFYGFDSTSIFLWGYLVMTSSGVEKCEIRSRELLNKLLEELNEVRSEPSGCDAGGTSITFRRDTLNQFVVERMKILQEVEQLEALSSQCIEERHKYFLNEGSEIRGLKSTRAQVVDTFERAKELAFDYSQVILAAETSDSNEKTNALLTQLRVLNEEQAESSRRIGLLNVLVGCMAIAPVTEFLVSLVPRLNSALGKSAIAAAILAAVVIIVRRAGGKK